MRRALIVDDDRIHAHMLVEGLFEWGVPADAAGGVAEALSSLRARQHGLVVSDVRMDDGDGFDLLAALRTEGILVPVILMSSFGTGGTHGRAMAAGAFAYLTKPFPLHELLALVENAFGEYASSKVR